MDCLKNIVGISKMDCLCLADGLSPEQIEAAKKSTSGLYLDANLKGMIKLSDIKYLDACGMYYKMASEAIEAAQRQYTDDLKIMLSEKYKSNRARFIGELGRLQYSGFLGAQKNLQYVKIQPNDINAAVIQIDSLRINISHSKTVTVKLISIIDGLSYGDIVYETTVQTTANKWVNVTIPEEMKLPFSVKGYKMSYYFVWEKEGNEQPVDNSTSCGCSGGDAYSQYVTFTGGQADDYDSFGGINDKFARGLSIGAQIYCDTAAVVCDKFYKEEAVSLISAWSVLFKAGEILFNKILMSSSIERITMMNREAMYGMRNHYEKEYNNRIAYLTTEIDLSSSGCFSCSNNKMYVGSIFG